MRYAYLTFDDSPNEETSNLVSYLVQKGIPAVFFCIGKNIESNYEISKDVIKSGFEIGNHSYSHPCFADISLDKCINEIEKNEAIIDAIYDSVGKKRRSKYFRFPYGNKGEKNRKAIQNYLKDNGYKKFANENIKYEWYKVNELDVDVDVFWTFDCEDYKLVYGSKKFGINDVLIHIDDASPKNGGSLVSGTGTEIVLMHDYAESHKRFPEYYRSIIQRIEEKGIQFIND